MTIRDWLVPEGATDRRTVQRRHHDRLALWANRAWLGVLTAMFIWMFFTLNHTISDLNTVRVEGTRQRCQLNEAIVITAVKLGVPPSSPNLATLKSLRDQCEQLQKKIQSQVDP